MKLVAMGFGIHSLRELDDPSVLESILELPESSALEFKTSLPSREQLARLIASFANAQGGLAIFGFDEWKRKVVGLRDPSGFDEAVQSALALLGPSPPTVSAELVDCRGTKLGVVMTVSQAKTPVLVGGARYERLGDKTVQAVVRVHEEVSTAEIDRFLDEASEDMFTDRLVVPLLRSMGVTVYRKGHRDKSLEFGQDLRGMRYELPTGHALYFAAQIKAGPIGYSPQSTTSIDRILEQLRMALNTPMMLWDTKSEHKADHVYLIASGAIAEGAQVYLRNNIDSGFGVLFWDKEQIVEHCTTRDLPPGVRRDILSYLRDAVADE